MVAPLVAAISAPPRGRVWLQAAAAQCKLAALRREECVVGWQSVQDTEPVLAPTSGARQVKVFLTGS